MAQIVDVETLRLWAKAMKNILQTSPDQQWATENIEWIQKFLSQLDLHSKQLSVVIDTEDEKNRQMYAEYVERMRIINRAGVLYSPAWTMLCFNMADTASKERRRNPPELPTALRRQEVKAKTVVTTTAMERTTIQSINQAQLPEQQRIIFRDQAYVQLFDVNKVNLLPTEPTARETVINHMADKTIKSSRVDTAGITRDELSDILRMRYNGPNARIQ